MLDKAGVLLVATGTAFITIRPAVFISVDTMMHNLQSDTLMLITKTASEGHSKYFEVQYLLVTASGSFMSQTALR